MSETEKLQILLFKLVKCIKTDLEHHLAQSKTGITVLQYAALQSAKKAPITLNELARQLGMKPPSLVPTIDSLEKDGYIHREQDKDDRRKVHLKITEKGLEILRHIVSKQGSELLDKAMDSIGEKRISQTVETLELLNSYIKKEQIKE